MMLNRACVCIIWNDSSYGVRENEQSLCPLAATPVKLLPIKTDIHSQSEGGSRLVE